MASSATICYVILASYCLIHVCQGQPPGVPPRTAPPPTLQGPAAAEEKQDEDEPRYHDFDYDGLPGVSFELKVTIPARRQECFFQKVPEGAQIHVIYEGLRGADRKLDFMIFRPDGELLMKHPWETSGTLESKVEIEGDYGFCVGNKYSAMYDKLVYVFITTYLHKDWKEYSAEVADFQLSIRNFSHALQTVDSAIQGAKRHLASSRQHHTIDWYAIVANNSQVQKWSLVMCFVIVVTSGLQTFFVRRLFRSTNVTPSAKPRA